MIKVKRLPDGTYLSKGPCGSAVLYHGEDAKVIELVIKYQNRNAI